MDRYSLAFGRFACVSMQDPLVARSARIYATHHSLHWVHSDYKQVTRSEEGETKSDSSSLVVDLSRLPPCHDPHHRVGEAMRGLELAANHLTSPLASASSTLDDATNGLLTATVVENKRLTPDDWFQDTRSVTLRVDASEPLQLDIKPGDVVGVWPKQDRHAIDSVLKACGLRYDDIVRVVQAQMQMQPSPMTSKPSTLLAKAGHLLEGFVDVHGVAPRRTCIEAMAQLCPDGMYKERLAYLASAQGREAYVDYVIREGRTLVDVMADFSCVPFSLAWILTFAPRLQCRLYSMAGIDVDDEDGFDGGVGGEREDGGDRGDRGDGRGAVRLNILAAMVEWKTPGRRLRRGLCSKTIAALAPGDRITIHVASGDLNPPPPSVPMILVGPGTGVAPLRAFLQDRQRQWMKATGERGNTDNSIGASSIAPSILFYGCRDRTKDYYFAEEWGEMVHTGSLQEVVVATSREPAMPKRYVQNLIKERGELVREWIVERGAHVYVCGRADSMPSEVERVLGELLAEVGLDKKFLNKRFHVECWS